MFIAVGPPSFTALAFIGMAQDFQLANIFPDYMALNGIENQAIITDVLSLLALIMAIFLWVLAFVSRSHSGSSPRSSLICKI
jgi:tellurite resistance protein TehA-like permease